MTEEEILQAVRQFLPPVPSPVSPSVAPSAAVQYAAVSQRQSPMIVLTGGEPTLQDTAPLIDLLHQEGFFVAMETNGTHPLPHNLDWSTVSPKGAIAVTRCNELKLVFTETCQPERFLHIEADFYYLQPCDVGNQQRNQAIIAKCVEYVKTHPLWRLSLQTHKLAGFK